MTSFFNSGLIFLNQAPVCKFDTLIYKECLKISYNSILTYTYMTSVLARIVPQCLVLDELGPIEGECILGVNFKELVVLRGKGSNQ